MAKYTPSLITLLSPNFKDKICKIKQTSKIGTLKNFQLYVTQFAKTQNKHSVAYNRFRKQATAVPVFVTFYCLVVKIFS